MKKLTALALAAGLAACVREPNPMEYTNASGSLALSLDGKLVYVAESDTNAMVAMDAKTLEVVGRVPVGDWPERVTVGPDERIYVSNRLSRSVSVIEKGNWTAPVNEIAVGAEPIGLSVSADGKKLAVANSTSGTVSLVDLGTLDVREVPAAMHVTGVRFVGNDKIYASVYQGGQMVTQGATTGGQVITIDAQRGTRRMNPIDLRQQIDLTPPGCSFCTATVEDRDPNLVPDVVVSQTGRVYVPHVQVKAEPAATDIPGAYYGTQNSSGLQVPVVASAVTTIDTEQDTIVPQSSLTRTEGEVVPPALFVAEGEPMTGPSAAALHPSGDWLFIANQNSDNVVVIATDGRSVPNSVQGIAAKIKVGAAPKGIAVSKDGQAAYVHNALDYTVTMLRADGNGTPMVAQTASVLGAVKSPVPEDVQRGRRLFFSANNARISNPNFGIACASCHPGGRDDGRTWDLPQQGLRNTPSLAGRNLADTKPYHWDGEFPAFDGFQKVIRERMGGLGASQKDFDDLLAFLDSKWNPAPENPNRAPDGGLTESQAAGRILFEGKAGCGACHNGASLTDNKSYAALRFTPRALADTLVGGNVNTPSLKGVFASAPYLHDGTAGTLEARVGDDRRGQHGSTSGLSAEERASLVAYLKTL